MKTAISLIFYTVFGFIGLMGGLAGHVFGWLFVAAAVWGFYAAIRDHGKPEDPKTDGSGTGSWFEIGGGCGGCGGCGG